MPLPPYVVVTIDILVHFTYIHQHYHIEVVVHNSFFGNNLKIKKESERKRFGL